MTREYKDNVVWSNINILFPLAKRAREKGECPTCGGPIEKLSDFRDALSRREFRISGMCQKCQDEVFGDD